MNENCPNLSQTISVLLCNSFMIFHFGSTCPMKLHTVHDLTIAQTAHIIFFVWRDIDLYNGSVLNSTYHHFRKGAFWIHMDVSKNNGFPQIIHLFTGFSIIFTIHFGGIYHYFGVDIHIRILLKPAPFFSQFKHPKTSRSIPRVSCTWRIIPGLVSG